MGDFTTLSGAIEALRAEGYTEDFNLQQNCLVCRQGQFKVFQDEFQIDKAMADKIPGSQLVVMKGIGHFPYVEAPGETQRYVKEFLK
jgi:hypothetical protein